MNRSSRGHTFHIDPQTWEDFAVSLTGKRRSVDTLLKTVAKPPRRSGQKVEHLVASISERIAAQLTWGQPLWYDTRGLWSHRENLPDLVVDIDGSPVYIEVKCCGPRNGCVIGVDQFEGYLQNPAYTDLLYVLMYHRIASPKSELKRVGKKQFTANMISDMTACVVPIWLLRAYRETVHPREVYRKATDSSRSYATFLISRTHAFELSRRGLESLDELAWDRENNIKIYGRKPTQA